jgi:hypothetical protein
MAGVPIAVLTGDGPIQNAIADGRGGWFVAGAFTMLGGRTQRGLAHVLPGGKVDPVWQGALGAGSRPTILAVARSAVEAPQNGVLYASAWIDDRNRSEFAAFDAVTGRPRPVPAIPETYGIDALAVTGNELLVAQDTGAAPRAPSCLHAFDTRTGAPLKGFAVMVRMQPELGCIESLVPAAGRVYLAGYFQQVDGVPRPGLALIDAHTGALDRRFRPPPAACGPGAPRGAGGCYGVVHRVIPQPGRGTIVALTDPGGPVVLDARTGAPRPAALTPAAQAAIRQTALSVVSGSETLTATSR